MTIALIVIFGIAALIPAVWSIIGLITGRWKFWPAVLGTGWAFSLLLVTFIGIATEWGGCSGTSESNEGSVTCVTRDTPTGCNPDVWAAECGRPSEGCGPIAARQFCPRGQRSVFVFCERIEHGSAVKQPWATWSDLSFIAAGLWILWFFQYFWRPSSTTDAANPMITIGWLSVIYGMIVIFMGPPSQWFHASMKEWGGWFDAMSVVAWLLFNAIYVFYTLIFAMWGNGRGIARTITVLSVWAGLMILFGLIGWFVPGSRLIFYFISGGLWGIAEVIYIFVAAFANGVRYRRTWWLFITNLILLGLTMTIWVLFNDGIVSPSTCQDREWFPGHALFHILASFSTVLTFASFASERRV